MVVRKSWCIRLIKLFCPWTSVCPWAIAMMNTQKEIQKFLKGENKMNNTKQVYNRMVGAGRKILETDFSNGPMLLGPLWLLWHGEWRLAIRSYLPLTTLYVAAHGLVSYGAAGDSMLLFRMGTIGIGLCILVAAILNFRWCLRWPKVPHGKGGHWGLPLLWLAGLYLALNLVMRLGMLL